MRDTENLLAQTVINNIISYCGKEIAELAEDMVAQHSWIESDTAHGLESFGRHRNRTKWLAGSFTHSYCG